jgi:ferricrocin synthase
MTLVPRGTPGELVVAGPLVGIGYHELPEVTRKVFLEWPEKGMRAYRTGDVGSYFDLRLSSSTHANGTSFLK